MSASVGTTTAAAASRTRLRDAIVRLELMDRKPAVRLALAEAEFRLAVAPETDPAEALIRLGKAISHDPFLPKLYLHQGRLLHRAGKHTMALSAYRHAITLAPSSRRAHLLMALALLELGKPERDLGYSLVDALVHGSADEVRAVVTELDAHIAAQTSPDGPKAERGGKGKRKSPRRTPPGAAGDGTGEKAKAAKNIWRVALTEQLSRQKPSRAEITAHLRTGLGVAREANGVTEYAAACVLMAVLGDPPAEIRRLAEAAGVDLKAGQPESAMLDAALNLCQAGDPFGFVAQACEYVDDGVVPPEPVMWLHFSRYVEPDKLSALESILLVDSYTATVRALDCFQELRIAVLDHYARRAWAGGRFAEAGLLWREAAALDPHRIPLAINLALLAAKTRSVADYPSAWERLPELLYLHAAGAGDIQVLLDDRKALHLSLSQQSFHRYCPQPSRPDRPSQEELSAWLGDEDALTVWLREWDLYYLNARLHFRSPVHLLGQPKDASIEGLTEARDVLVRHIDTAVASRGWAGVKVFCELARAQVEEAFQLAADPLNRARDPYYELEKAQAQALADEMLQRVLLLRKLVQALIRCDSGRVIRLGCSIARRQFALPRAALQQHCVDKGLIDPEEELFEFLETDLVALASRWDRPERPAAVDHDSLVAALYECVQTVPHRLELRVIRGRLLLDVGSHREAYTSALEALDVAVGPKQQENEDEIREALVDVADHAGYLTIPESLRQPKDQASAENTIAVIRAALREFPRSATLRRLQASLLVGLGGEARIREAVKVLSEGIEQALSDAQRQELEKELRSIRADAAKEAARKQVRDLAQPALDRVKEAVDGLRGAGDRQAVRDALEVVRQAQADVSQALATAQASGFTEEQRQLGDALSQLRQLERQLERAEE